MNAVRPAENPFASHRVESLSYRMDDLRWPDLMQRLDKLGGRAAIVGPKGSGKTTLLEEMSRNFPQSIAWIRIPGSSANPWSVVQQQLPNGGASGHAVLIDGAEQLSAFAWRRFVWRVRHSNYLVATLHKPGRLPTLIECRTAPALLRELVDELAPQQLRIPERRLDKLFEHHGGNLRLCFRELYDVYAGRDHREF